MIIPFESALEILLANCSPVGQQTVALEASLNRVLARDIVAREQIPGFQRSSMDGYALKARDTERASADTPLELTVLEELKAGALPSRAIRSGTCSKVMTGAMIPEGADSVIKFEDTAGNGESIVIREPLALHSNIIDTGEDIGAGQLIAGAGQAISPPLMGVLASLGLAQLAVYRRVVVGILSTGDELCAINEQLTPGQIRNSNAYSLAGYCQAICAKPLVLGIAADNKQALREKYRQGLEQADIVISTGGSSTGDYDLVAEVLAEMGAETLFSSVGMKPGKPTLAAKLGGKLVVSLSGNPSAAVTSFLLMVAPTIKKMGGHQQYRLFSAKAALLDDFPHPIRQRRFLRGKLLIKDDKLAVDLSRSQKNSVLTSMIGCDVLVDVPAGSGGIKKGEVLPIQVFDKVSFFRQV